ncbi:hypothetical protein QR680_008031 [Steinernema hermaphroditum]|uniref:Glucose-methanol-choline oxidoreductase N-terminal domain-containing protein n=1 Tax=Steinernema hermaphroditum TaxID=289476 RepID=A0AA39IF28_9BILA|nr:hypothetical protein QR680_008031 [Steinernema hermaphroditum]
MCSTRSFAVVVALVAVATFYFYQAFVQLHLLPVRTVNELQPQYEYIIVGGGTAGAVLASRLSEDPKNFVLLLEAGEQAPFYAHIPYVAPLIQDGSYDWNFTLERQADALYGYHGQTEQWHYGKMLGGSSMMSLLLHEYPNSEKWNEWAEKNGVADMWSWSKLKPYFDKAERGDEHVKISVQQTELMSVSGQLKQIAKKVGFEFIEGVNQHQKIGFAPVYSAVGRGGFRSSTLDYLKDGVAHRFNLHIVTGAQVTKLSLNEDNKVTGVDYIYNGRLQRVLTNREVILSAGVINSPKLLQLSGIGPEALLKKHEVPVHVDLPRVGENLVGAVVGGFQFAVEKDCTREHEFIMDGFTPKKLISNILHVIEYLTSGKGRLASTWWDLMAYLPFDEMKTSGKADFRVMFVPQDITPTLKFSNIKSKFYNKLTENLGDDCPLFMKLALLDYRSTGKVEITSADPLKEPLIDPMFLTANEDVENFLKALRQLKKLLDLPEFRSLKLRLAEKQTHDCVGDEWSEEFLICMIRNRFGTRSQSHTSTCQIGNSEENGVVDSHLRVFGVPNLRIVDASVLPTCMAPVGALPTVIVLAERAADIIKETYA